MASITKRPSVRYRVQIKRKGLYTSETFLRRDDAQKWARQAETLVDQGLPPDRSSVTRLHSFGDLVDLHRADMPAVGKPLRRIKTGSDQRIPLFAATGFDAWALVLVQVKTLGQTK